MAAGFAPESTRSVVETASTSVLNAGATPTTNMAYHNILQYQPKLSLIDMFLFEYVWINSTNTNRPEDHIFPTGDRKAGSPHSPSVIVQQAGRWFQWRLDFCWWVVVTSSTSVSQKFSTHKKIKKKKRCKDLISVVSHPGRWWLVVQGPCSNAWLPTFGSATARAWNAWTTQLKTHHQEDKQNRTKNQASPLEPLQQNPEFGMPLLLPPARCSAWCQCTAKRVLPLLPWLCGAIIVPCILQQ